WSSDVCSSVLSFRAVFHGIVERLERGIDELGIRHRLRVGITRVLADTENDDLLRYADLRCRQPRAVERSHRVLHIREQRMQLGGIECLERLRDLQKPRIAHLENWS